MRPTCRRHARVIYPAILVVILVLGWDFAARFGGVPRYLLPLPEMVARSLADGVLGGRLLDEGLSTLLSAIAGYVLGSTIAAVTGTMIAQSKWLERFLLQVLTGFQAIPKVALAPLVFIWFGFGSKSVIILVTLACFFPVFTSMLVGLRSVDPMLIDLYRAHCASRTRILLDVQLPAAMSYLFSGLQVAIVFAFIATVVMEFIIGTQGLGFVIQDSVNVHDLGLSFAAVVLLAVLGVSGAALVRRTKSTVVFWERADQPSGARAAL